MLAVTSCLGPLVKASSEMDVAMNTMNWDPRNLPVQTHCGLCWSDIKRQLADWRHLEGLDDWCLQDIGISRGTANLEAAKPAGFDRSPWLKLEKFGDHGMSFKICRGRATAVSSTFAPRLILER